MILHFRDMAFRRTHNLLRLILLSIPMLVSGCISYSSPDSTIMRINSEQSPWFQELAWSPDEDYLVLVSEDLGSLIPPGNLYTLNVSSGTLAQLTETQGVIHRSPDWSDHVDRITYETNQWPAGIWTINSDGTDESYLMDGDISRWNPTNNGIAVLSIDPEGEIKERTTWLYIFDDSGNLLSTSEIARGESIVSVDMIWSPDGAHIAVVLTIFEDEDVVNERQLYIFTDGGSLLRHMPIDILSCIDWIDSQRLLCSKGEYRDNLFKTKFVSIDMEAECSEVLLDIEDHRSLRLSPDKMKVAYINNGDVYLSDLESRHGERVWEKGGSCD